MGIIVPLSPIQKLPLIMADVEARSTKNIKDTGAVRYAEDPTTEFMCMSHRPLYNINGKPQKTAIWIWGQPFPEYIVEHVKAGHPIAAHNVLMEFSMWYYHLYKKLGIPMPTRWVDTQASCAYRGMPLALDDVGKVLGLDVQKDRRGKYLIQTLCKPRKLRKAEKKVYTDLGIEEKDFPIVYREDEDLKLEFYDYCITDTDSEIDVLDTLGPLPKQEYSLWTMDQRINWRGVQVDMEAVKAALYLVDKISEELTAELVDITDGELETAGQVAKIIDWLQRHGFPWVDNLRADTVKDLVKQTKDSEEHKIAHRVLFIRQQLSKSSTKKYIKFLETVCEDGRVRGVLQYHGAGTGRWAGRLVQPQNFPRGSLEEYCKIYDMLDYPGEMMKILVDTIKLKDLAALKLAFRDPMEALATALRGMFIAKKGKKFYVADFSAIEAVVTAWLAGEEWKVKAFEKIQKGEGYEGSPDIYMATASGIFGYPVTDKKTQSKERGIGKICELAFGYQGALGAWRAFDSSDKYTDEEVRGFCYAWRDKHPRIVNLWYGLQRAAIAAVENPGRRFTYRSISYEIVEDKAGKWLSCILPNGRRLWYYEPEIEEYYDNTWGRDRKDLVYQGRDNKRGGQWGLIRSYGGMLTENVVQAIARDIMVEAMFRLEKNGFPIVMTVHDEVVCEVPEDTKTKEEFKALMAEKSSWLEGCPVGTDAWIHERYRK